MKEYSQIYYDEGFSDIVVENLNKELKEKAIKLDNIVIQPTGGGTICLYGVYTKKENNNSKILTEKKKEGNANE